MKRLLMATCLVLASGTAYGEWELITESRSGGVKVYVDYSTIRQKGNLVKMWNILDYQIPQPERRKAVLSSKAQREYDCAEERIRILGGTSFAGHMGSGEVVERGGETEIWMPVAQGTLGEALWVAACKKRS
jgi:Surface-adhesin protein E